MQNQHQLVRVGAVALVFAATLTWLFTTSAGRETGNDIVDFFRGGPRNVNVFTEDLNQAREHIRKREYEAARSIVDKLAKADPSHAEVLRLRFVVNDLLGDSEKALAAIKAYVAVNGFESKYWLAYIDLEKARGAERAYVESLYEQALEAVKVNVSKREQANIYTSYASYERAWEAYDDAIRYLEEAKILNPSASAQYDADIESIREEQRQKGGL